MAARARGNNGGQQLPRDFEIPEKDGFSRSWPLMHGRSTVSCAHNETGQPRRVYVHVNTAGRTQRRETDVGNGPFLHLCHAIGRLPRLLHHLLSTAQRVPLSRQFRVLHRGVCTEDHVGLRSRGEHKRRAHGDRRTGTSSPGVIQVYADRSTVLVHGSTW